MRAAGNPGLDTASFAPPAGVGGGEHGHLAQFYEVDSFLLDAVSRFVGAGLAAGAGGVVIATRPHLDGIAQRLEALGVDVPSARARGRYVALDAAETLARFMEDGWPHARRFAEVVGEVVAQATDGGLGLPARVFGEMVALLFAQGHQKAANRLEELWNELAATHPFSLLCGYALRSFARAVDGTALADVCAAHSGVLPAESYAALPSAGDRLRSITRLQQKANALEAEVAERRALEKLLRRREKELSGLLAREQSARADAERLARAKDDFLATLSHELRTPLTAMLGWVRMLRSGQLDPARSAYALEVLERNTQAQARLIEDLLDVSRVITGRLHLDLRQVELAPVVLGAMETLRPTAEAKAIRLEAALDPAVGPVAGDPDRLQQIVSNLISNALKFTPAGGRVEVALRRVESAVAITVTDTGLGISADFLPHLFERFTQAGRGPSRAHGGLGLGLAIVRHLVELHGGTVQAESPGEGLGSTFTVRLPVPDVELGRSLDGRRDGGERAPSIGRLRPLEGVRVLLVEDEADARALFTAILEQGGAETWAVGSVAEALAALDRAEPDVVVSDIAMPGQNGYDLVETLRRSRADRPPIPAVAVTAYARPEDRARACAAGFEEHMSKPVEPDELVRVVAMLAKRPLAA